MPEQNAKARVAALHSRLTIQLHTYYAISVWNGRQKTETVKEIIGMPVFFGLVSRIYADARKDNPYADMALLSIETLINEAQQTVQVKLDKVTQLLSERFTNQLAISEISSLQPLNIAVYSHTPVGYRCVYLLVDFDRLVMKLMQAFHYGLISQELRDSMLKEAARFIRRIIGVARSYRPAAISRMDIANNEINALKIIKQFGSIDTDVLLGIKRSMFSPPISQASLEQLKIHLSQMDTELLKE